MKKTCQLCQRENEELLLSHIIPNFVWRWLKRTSPGHLRMYHQPNLRIQDGPKDYLLCADCENKLSRWEKQFFEEIFLPFHDPQPTVEPILYEKWALKFAVSISWRVAIYFKSQSLHPHLSRYQQQEKKKALEIWRKYLLDEIDHLGEYSQHLLPVDVIEDFQGPMLSPFLNRYLLRSVHLDIISSSGSVYVYAKMCRIILFGRIQEKYPHEFSGMELSNGEGYIGPTTYRLPARMLDYWNQKANEIKRSMESMSPRQRKKVNEVFERETEDVIRSEAFRAFMRDYEQTGFEAFSKNDEKEKE